MKIDVHEAVEHGLHELVVEGLEVVVGEFDPLEAVQILKRGRLDLPDAGKVGDEKYLIEPLIVTGSLTSCSAATST